jgi:hypothetical protein
VALVVGLSLADVAYKQVVLSSTAKNSQVAFYRADSAMECVLYWDQKFARFNTKVQAPIVCENQSITTNTYDLSDGGVRTEFSIPCADGTGTSALVTIYKQTTGTCSASGSKNCLYTSGFNSCSQSDPNRFERGLKVRY